MLTSVNAKCCMPYCANCEKWKSLHGSAKWFGFDPIEWVLPWPMPQLSTKWHENWASSFCVVLLTSRQIAGTKNITSLAEVKIKKGTNLEQPYQIRLTKFDFDKRYGNLLKQQWMCEIAVVLLTSAYCMDTLEKCKSAAGLVRIWSFIGDWHDIWHELSQVPVLRTRCTLSLLYWLFSVLDCH